MDDFDACEDALLQIYWRRFANRWHVTPADLPAVEIAIITHSLSIGDHVAAATKPGLRFEIADETYLILRGLQAFMEDGKNALIRRRGDRMYRKVAAAESVMVLSEDARETLTQVGRGFLQSRGMS